MSKIQEKMPVLFRHQGEWEGICTVFDIKGKIIDEHESYLSCEFPEAGDYSYSQINRYTWADGKQKEHHFTGIYEDKKLIFNTESIVGKAWEVDDSTILLWLSYKRLSNTYLYEMINISPCSQYRFRTWKWYKDNQVFKITSAQEKRTSNGKLIIENRVVDSSQASYRNCPFTI
ncbi:hypothetical protein Riv7116_5711 [Rivularia sp. PCC 7116]|uniref:DUF3598 family protein n=1 Tax=Rivularia sp. PCC 7116 TaxID=373994 RepID=UPI00029F4CF0|nr:hypothetical protein Riv7116_5711 [Rivularia sp. PCC 7116]